MMKNTFKRTVRAMAAISVICCGRAGADASQVVHEQNAFASIGGCAEIASVSEAIDCVRTLSDVARQLERTQAPIRTLIGSHASKPREETETVALAVLKHAPFAEKSLKDAIAEHDDRSLELPAAQLQQAVYSSTVELPLLQAKSLTWLAAMGEDEQTQQDFARQALYQVTRVSYTDVRTASDARSIKGWALLYAERAREAASLGNESIDLSALSTQQRMMLTADETLRRAVAVEQLSGTEGALKVIHAGREQLDAFDPNTEFGWWNLLVLVELEQRLDHRFAEGVSRFYAGPSWLDRLVYTPGQAPSTLGRHAVVMQRLNESWSTTRAEDLPLEALAARALRDTSNQEAVEVLAERTSRIEPFDAQSSGYQITTWPLICDALGRHIEASRWWRDDSLRVRSVIQACKNAQESGHLANVWAAYTAAHRLDLETQTRSIRVPSIDGIRRTLLLQWHTTTQELQAAPEYGDFARPPLLEVLQTFDPADDLNTRLYLSIIGKEAVRLEQEDTTAWCWDDMQRVESPWLIEVRDFLAGREALTHVQAELNAAIASNAHLWDKAIESAASTTEITPLGSTVLLRTGIALADQSVARRGLDALNALGVQGQREATRALGLMVCDVEAEPLDAAVLFVPQKQAQYDSRLVLLLELIAELERLPEHLSPTALAHALVQIGRGDLAMLFVSEPKHLQAFAARSEALDRLGRTEEAFAIWRQLAARELASSDGYFYAWTRMLEVRVAASTVAPDERTLKEVRRMHAEALSGTTPVAYEAATRLEQLVNSTEQ